ncbi:MAG: hypothetical protein JXR70_02595 [Spirochaetales bacterium]|nr:hypothetical protein [Spirochaetales bacterium]
MIRNINRGALIVTPTDEFHLMVAKLLEDEAAETENMQDHDSSTLYLVEPELDPVTNETIDEYVKTIFSTIAIAELEAWIDDTTLMPKNITWETFQEWFSYSYQSLIFDIMEDDIMYEDDYEDDDFEDDDYEDDYEDEDEDYDVDYEDEDE